MPRVKRGVTANRSKRNMRKHAKGFRHGRNSKITRMTEALAHAFTYMFAHRRRKKGDFRTLWNTQINAASRENGLSYSVLISKLKKAGIALNRKMLSQIAQENPKVFTKVIEAAK